MLALVFEKEKVTKVTLRVIHDAKHLFGKYFSSLVHKMMTRAACKMKSFCIAAEVFNRVRENPQNGIK